MNNSTYYFYPEAFVSFLMLVIFFCCSAFLGYSETSEIVEDQTPEGDQTAEEPVIEEPAPTGEPPLEEPVPEGMVLIPAGEFEMGSNDEDAYEDEQPVHTVYVDAFYMDTHEVTNAEFQRFVLANPHWQKERIRKAFHDGTYLKHWTGNNYPTGKGNHPVRYISWYAAVAYSKWVGKRLPTEAEWEKAARGGLAGQKYPWGNTIDPSRANYNNHIGGTTAVGEYPANGYGLYDMSGNVREWCLDAYNGGFYSVSPSRNPVSGANSIRWILDNYINVNYNSRVLRGGAWFNSARFVRCATRGIPTPVLAYVNGFRCVRAITP